MESNEIKGIPFVSLNSKNEFYITDESKEFLNKLENKNLAILSIVGKYRSGKSFLMNKLLNENKKMGFDVGSTINACTKGLWLWSETIKIKNENGDLEILIIDSEGFGAFDVEKKHDFKIFLFTILLSSFFLFNSVGSIDEKSLKDLSLIIDLVKNIKEVDYLSKNFPYFLWVLRDFALKKENIKGEKITSKEYLENSIAELNGVSESTDNKNRMRKLIKHYFKQRDCITMIRPVETERDLQKLNTLDNKYIRPEFLNQIEILRKKIFNNIKPKKFGNEITNGSMLIEAAISYSHAINNSSIINMENTWKYLEKKENTNAYNTSLDLMKKYLKSKNFNENKNWEIDLREKIISNFKRRSIGDDINEIQNKLIIEFNDKINQTKEDIKKENLINLEKNLNNEFITINDKLNNEDFENDKELFEELNEIENKLKNDENEDNIKILIQNKKILIYERLYNRLKNNKEKKFMELKQKSKNQKNSYEQLKLDFSKLENENYKLKLNNKSLEDKIEFIEKNNLQNNLRKTKTVNVEEIKKVENNNNEKFDNLNKLINEYKEKEINLNSKIDSLLKDNNNYKLEINKLNDNLNEKLNNINNNTIENNSEELEKENKDLKLKINKINKILEEKNIDILNLNNQIKDIKVMNEIQINSLKAKIDNSQDINNYKIQIECNETQIDFLKKQLEDNKKNNYELINNFKNFKNLENNTNNQEMNYIKTLNLSNKKNIIKIKQLEEKIEKYKNFKTMCKNTLKFQCLACQNFYTFPNYLNHLYNCYEEETIKDKNITIFVNCEIDKNNFIEYSFHINNNGKKIILKKNFKDFTLFHHLLKEKFPNIKLKGENLFIKNENYINYDDRNENIEERKIKLKSYWIDLFKHPKINKSNIFNNFIGTFEEEYQSINSEFTEDSNFNDYNMRPNRTENEDKINKLMKNLKSENFEYKFSKKGDKTII